MICVKQRRIDRAWVFTRQHAPEVELVPELVCTILDLFGQPLRFNAEFDADDIPLSVFDVGSSAQCRQRSADRVWVFRIQKLLKRRLHFHVQGRVADELSDGTVRQNPRRPYQHPHQHGIEFGSTADCRGDKACHLVRHADCSVLYRFVKHLVRHTAAGHGVGDKWGRGGATTGGRTSPAAHGQRTVLGGLCQ